MSAHTRVGEQLVLELEDRRLPWNGVSLRYLTKAYARFSLASEGTGRVDPAIDVDLQVELFPKERSFGS